MNYVPFAKNASEKVIEFFKILFFFPIRYLLLRLNVTFIWVSVLGVHFVIVRGQNTSCKILLELLNCHKLSKKLYSWVWHRYRHQCALSWGKLRDCWGNVEGRHNLEILINWWNCDIARWRSKTHFSDKYSEQNTKLLVCSKKTII